MGARGPKGDKLISDALRVAMLRDAKTQDDEGKARKRVHAMAEKMAELAEDGDQFAVQFVTDRLEGKPKQAVDHGGQDDNPLIHEIRRTIVRPGS